ncbi:lysophospholipid acyltransferase family protein [Thiocystis violacea]|uniref:lysophospholipid acyltransferase family protein n=1 Tax=Thiocystis violacea TaxID=13725 RepID=UPI0019065C57|nr:lysophospholipid acyltransferase family protein [Thiocystis violacea]MBK1716346.1 1-acyl-sn-glycerol-3-phosphate acyltransferase [Thiocystis violacea]
MTHREATLGIRLRSLLFFILYNLMGMAHSLLSLALAPFQTFEQRYRFVNLWTRASLWLLRRLNGIEIEVSGLENLPRGEALVVMSNHQSEWETFYLQLLISPQATVLKRELLWVPFFGWALALLQPIAIDRSRPVSAMKTLLREGKRRLDRGVSVVIYPEGTRQPPGRIGRFNAGGAKLACHAGKRVLPIAHNAGDCWPARSLLRRPGRIRLVIGEPIDCDAGPEALITRTEEWIRETATTLMSTPADGRG